MMRRRNLFAKCAGAFLGHERGAAAAEFAIWAVILVPAVVNAVDVGFYAWDKTQVSNAAQAGVQAAFAAWANCASATSTSGCTGFSTQVSRAITNSSFIGGSVSQGTASASEGYYCADVSTGALVSNGTSSSCSTGAIAGYYFPLKVTFTYTPLFRGATVTSLLNTTMSQESWIRLK